MPESEITAEDFVDGSIELTSLLVKAGLVKSKTEGRRAVEQGGVSVNGEKITDVKYTLTEADFAEELILKRGKKNFRKIILK